MAEYQILYWQDIPAQIKVYDGARGRSFQLPPAFQVEIDRVAMEQGLFGTDEYLNQWKWSPRQELPGTPDEVRQQVLQMIEKQHKSGSGLS